VFLLAVKIRLARAGAKKAPFYRIVAADTRSPRDGRFIEILGRYNPRVEPSMIELDVDKLEAWLDKGAQMSERVTKIYEIAKNPDAPMPEAKDKVSKKAEAKAKADAEAAEKAAEEEAAAEEAPAEEADDAEEPAAEEAPEEAPEEDTPAADDEGSDAADADDADDAGEDSSDEPEE
jgi:small subunit ribosomal protein S16